MSWKGLGWFLLRAGFFLALCGIFLILFPHIVGKLGHLPGDIRWEKNGVRVYIPLTTMLILSLLLTLMINLFFRGKG
jgi:hypothetical protein